MKWNSPISSKKGETSLPVRGAWIEMLCKVYWKKLCAVAPRAGSVD